MEPKNCPLMGTGCSGGMCGWWVEDNECCVVHLVAVPVFLPAEPKKEEPPIDLDELIHDIDTRETEDL